MFESNPKILLEDLSLSVVKRIISLYDLTVHGDGVRLFMSSAWYTTYGELCLGNMSCWKFGSSIGGHSFLYMEPLNFNEICKQEDMENAVVQFRFGVSPELENKKAEELARLTRKFNLTINAYLYNEDLLVIKEAEELSKQVDPDHKT